MASMGDAARKRRAAQRKLARQLKKGEKPLGGEYQKYMVQSLRQQAERNFDREVGHYIKYSRDKVHESIHKVMDVDQLIWTITADAEEIRSRAGNAAYVLIWDGQDRNPWWYH